MPRLAALRMQLNPHFLFNAMNSISSLMRTDVNAADTMLEQLSSLLRITLERGNVQLIPLRDEMEFIEVYLSMQDQRYAGRVRRDISIDSELHDALVPAMILQPIVENAYAHGLSKMEKDGELLIEAHRQSEPASTLSSPIADWDCNLRPAGLQTDTESVWPMFGAGCVCTTERIAHSRSPRSIRLTSRSRLFFPSSCLTKPRAA